MTFYIVGLLAVYILYIVGYFANKFVQGSTRKMSICLAFGLSLLSWLGVVIGVVLYTIFIVDELDDDGINSYYFNKINKFFRGEIK